MTNDNYRMAFHVIIACLFMISLTGAVSAQSMYMEERCSVAMVMGSITGNGSATTRGITVAVSPASILDLSISFGSTDFKNHSFSRSLRGLEIMIHPSRFSGPRDFSIAPYYSYTYSNKTEYTYATSTSTYGCMGFYRLKLSLISFLMFEVGMGTSKTSIDNYNGYISHQTMEYTIQAEFFGRVANNTMLTVNPGIFLFDDSDSIYGIGLGVIFFGSKTGTRR
jgi:hypothetical protein